MANILNVISAVTPAGGTITKLRVLMKNSKEHKHVLYHPGFKSSKEEILREIGWYEENNIPAYYGIYNRNVFKNALAISRIIKKHNIDVVHFYFNHEQTFAGLVKLLNPKVKMVRSIVGFDSRLSFMRRTLLNTALSFIDNYIYVSNYIKKLYEDEYPKLKKKNATIIYNGPVNVTTPDERIKRDLIVSVGGICERKNQKVLIDAVDILVNKRGRNDIQLYLLGEGPLIGEFSKLIEKLQLQNNVVLTGKTNQVASYLNKCKIYVHTATTEAFGIAVTEAMYMGCPCIVADKGALPELVDDNCGIIVAHDNPTEWANAIEILLNAPEQASAMGIHSRKRVEECFSLDAFIRNHDEYYRTLCK